MPTFEPFAGLRYDRAALAARGQTLDDVVCPPYDVIDPAEGKELAARSPFNAVRVELPTDEPEHGRDRYQAAAALLEAWQTDGVVVAEPEPALYGYRMAFTDHAGRPRTTSGIVGALQVGRPEEGGALPHEETTPKPRSDRLDLLRATRANLSPVWGLSLAPGLARLSQATGEAPAGRAVDGDGVVHEVWPITEPATVSAITSLVASAPVLMADGHHRYETALAYRAERREARGGAAGDYDSIMALVVELVEDELSVGPIHRIVKGLPEGFDLPAALSRRFEVIPGEGPGTGAALTETLQRAGGPALVTAAGSWYLRARPETGREAGDDLDTARLQLALDELPDPEVSYHHDPAAVVEAVRSGRARAGFLVRPAPVPVIAEAARDGRRMPAKTTFFTPKLRTGMVFRPVRD
ncbi:MAG: DUF1015 family protein [Acidimicrobiales bacterium]